MVIQDGLRTECEVRFLCESLKMGTHAVTETLTEIRKLELGRFILNEKHRNSRLIELVEAGK